MIRGLNIWITHLPVYDIYTVQLIPLFFLAHHFLSDLVSILAPFVVFLVQFL
jgi:hypothetical protein